MLKAPVPPGFSVAFSRHSRGWGWREVYKAKSEDHVDRRTGFRSRNLALADLYQEITRRQGIAIEG